MPENVEIAEGESSQVVVKDLWKIFGREPKRIFKHDLKNKSKEEIQKKTGCVVGMRNINLAI